jgi:hypothetical protein
MVLSFSSAGTILVFLYLWRSLEFRLQSELGRAQSHEHIYLGRVMRVAWREGKGVGFLPTRTRKVEHKAFSVAIQGSTKMQVVKCRL